ncbi:hypothetical protein DMB66_46965 [Actinoplanes sp. ATCC 53533]|uniref:HAMP domain-containing sensor histidine kinase n=1 Tax=Actinoplanes sp. ATCC 53533 TaxID=1288362 RepID=UPI000F77A88C|nr:HAMP domain-containing sensor histidine kinase [Actinoplanes sp. ATCC 53533]RSM48066.1 hypothetical protein DMB66_46965 [Actinoplanes sp. ATCC 53533]
MRRHRRSLRVRLAVLGFLAIYVPVLLLSGVVLATDIEITGTGPSGAEGFRESTTPGSTPVTWTILALGPVAAALAWWWAGRAVSPIDRIRAVADDIQGTDLGRRIALRRGPAEVTALAASFDAMLDRLEQAARTQQRLIEETSHELRIPLAVLVTNAEVLLAHPRPTLEVYRKGLERSLAAALRLRTAMDELLVDARGRARTINRQPADLTAIVRAVIDDAGAQAAAKKISLSATGPPDAICPVDQPTVRRAIHNLVDNAIRYAPPGTTVRATVEVAETEAAIVVTDHGPGIPAAEQNHAFERFWRGRPDVPGTGLGLAIARQVAAAHGGALTLTSPGPAGDGCTFRLTVRR